MVVMSPSVVALAGSPVVERRTERCVRVLIVARTRLTRAALRSLLDATAEIVVAGDADDLTEGARLADRVGADIVLVDLTEAGGDLTGLVHVVGPSVWDARRRRAIIVLSATEDDDAVMGALQAGAGAFLLKDLGPEELVAAIRTVAAGGALLTPSVTRRLLDRFADRFATEATGSRSRVPRLTDREREVLCLLAAGLSNREIAERLFLTEATVKSHVSSLLLKLDLRDRTQAVILAYESGLVRPGEADPGRPKGDS
jgi:DNA-binding NarL/FixJ family response regulator